MIGRLRERAMVVAAYAVAGTVGLVFLPVLDSVAHVTLPDNVLTDIFWIWAGMVVLGGIAGMVLLAWIDALRRR